MVKSNITVRKWGKEKQKGVYFYDPYAPSNDNSTCKMPKKNNTTDTKIKILPVLLFLGLKCFPPKNIATHKGKKLQMIIFLECVDLT